MEKYTAENYGELLKALDNLADEKYKAFHEKLVPGIANVRGVRSPQLKAVAKEIAKGDYLGYLKQAQPSSYEEIMIHGFVLGFLKLPIDIRLKYLAEFIPHITNWAVCDGTVANFKFKKDDEDTVYAFLDKYLTSDEEYEARVGCVFLMDYFITEKYIDEVLFYYNSIVSDKYYVNMAVAWGISVCFVKFPQKTMELLNNNALDAFTYNKALQKIIESNRVDDETKIIIRAMKRKK